MNELEKTIFSYKVVSRKMQERPVTDNYYSTTYNQVAVLPTKSGFSY